MNESGAKINDLDTSAATLNFWEVWRSDLERYALRIQSGIKKYALLLWVGLKWSVSLFFVLLTLLILLAIPHKFLMACMGGRKIAYLFEAGFYLFLYKKRGAFKSVFASCLSMLRRKKEAVEVVRLRMKIADLEAITSGGGVSLEVAEALRDELRSKEAACLGAVERCKVLEERLKRYVPLQDFETLQAQSRASELALKDMKRRMESMLYFKLNEGIEVGLEFFYRGKKKEIPVGATTSDYVVKDVFLKELKEIGGCVKDRFSGNAAYVSLRVFRQMGGRFLWETQILPLYQTTQNGLEIAFELSPKHLRSVSEPIGAVTKENNIIN